MLESKESTRLLLCIIRLVYTLFKRDIVKTMAWMDSPNEYFWGKSPFILIAAGEGDRVIKFLIEQSGNTNSLI